MIDEQKNQLNNEQYEEEFVEPRDVEEIQKKFQIEIEELKVKLNEKMIEQREAQESLAIKRREFDFVQRMQPEQYNKLLLHDDRKMIDTFLSYGQNKEKNITKEQQQLIHEKPNFDKIPTRNPLHQDVVKQYILSKQGLYNPMKDDEIRSLMEQFRNNKKEMYQVSDSNFNYEFDIYKQRYQTFLINQSKSEQMRQKMVENLGYIYQMMSVQKNKPDLNNPKIWNRQPMNQQDQQYVDQYIDRKLKQLSKQLHADIEIDDITKKVDEYFSQNFNEAQSKYLTQNLNA